MLPKWRVKEREIRKETEKIETNVKEQDGVRMPFTMVRMQVTGCGYHKQNQVNGSQITLWEFPLPPLFATVISFRSGGVWLLSNSIKADSPATSLLGFCFVQGST